MRVAGPKRPRAEGSWAQREAARAGAAAQAIGELAGEQFGRSMRVGTRKIVSYAGAAAKPRETLVEAGRCADVQIAPPTRA